MDKKNSPNRLKKEKIVAELVEKLNRSKGMVFTNYQGLTHKQMESLRKKIQEMNADFVATKNTLIKLSLDQTQNSKLNPFGKLRVNAERSRSIKTQNHKTLSEFKNSTAALFLYGDPVGPLKELARALKEFNLSASPASPRGEPQGGPTVKFGILEGVTLTSEQILRLSTLPSRKALLAQLVFGLKSPIFGLHRALNWNIQKFVMTLQAISDKKQAISK